jgi:hypothetical protein
MAYDISKFRARFHEDVTRTIGHTPHVRHACLIHRTAV